MSDTVTVAHPYAKALFELAKAKNTTDQWLMDLSALADVAHDKSFNALVDNPRGAPEALVATLLGFLKNPNKEVKGFLELLQYNGRLTSLSQIFMLFDGLVKEDRKIADAVIYSAFVMNDTDKKQLEELLGNKFGRKVSATITVEPELIGGIKVLINDTVIDASVKGSLDKMATQII